MQKRVDRSSKAIKESVLVIDDLRVVLIRKRIKNLHLYVKPPDGRIVVTAPLRMPEHVIRDLITSKSRWIHKHKKRMAHQQVLDRRLYQTGEMLSLWGVQLQLQVQHDGRRKACNQIGDQVILTAPSDSTYKDREAIIIEWYRSELKAALQKLIPEWEVRTGLHCSSWHTQNMKTRWGSCNIKSSRLRFNVQLAKYPPSCLEYVIVHELMHLHERYHNERFWSLVARYIPDWKTRRAFLNGRRS